MGWKNKSTEKMMGEFNHTDILLEKAIIAVRNCGRACDISKLTEEIKSIADDYDDIPKGVRLKTVDWEQITLSLYDQIYEED